MARNKKHTVMLLVFILVLGGGAIFGYLKYNNQKIFNEYLLKADKAIVEKNYDAAQLILEEAKNIKVTEELANKMNLVSLYIDQNKILENTLVLIEKNEFENAIQELNKIDSKAIPIKQEADEKIELCKDEIIKLKSDSIVQLLNENKFDEAYGEIDTVMEIDADSEVVASLKKQVDDSKVAYEVEQERLRVEEEEKIKKEELNKQKQIISKAEAIQLAADKVISIYKKEGIYEKLRKNSGRIGVVEVLVEDIEIDGINGYLVPVAESYRDHNATTYRVFVNKINGELYNANKWHMAPGLSNQLEQF